jgi:hypothetical protein
MPENKSSFGYSDPINYADIINLILEDVVLCYASPLNPKEDLCHIAKQLIPVY